MGLGRLLRPRTRKSIVNSMRCSTRSRHDLIESSRVQAGWLKMSHIDRPTHSSFPCPARHTTASSAPTLLSSLEAILARSAPQDGMDETAGAHP